VPGHGSGKTSEPVTTTHCVRLLHLEKKKIDQRFHHDYPQHEFSAETTLITQREKFIVTATLTLMKSQAALSLMHYSLNLGKQGEE